MAQGPAQGDPRGRAVVAVPECTACGTCCLGWQPDYIRVWAVDLARLDDRAFALTQVRGAERYLRFEHGRCAALSLAADGRASCNIYSMRPDACRWLERGSGACRAQIDAKWAMRRALLAQLSEVER